ncbi:hypothetical protein ACFQ1Q_06475 [Winogradskyella litorisediminis]|uniref:Copper chaperone CopZ n=1 Tax=Winogradskyella litorisediminis TaxID=1156618 RepID=A0ABW3N8N3_9FLAO
MTINLLSCNSVRPDKRAIANCIAEIAIDVNPSLAHEFTNIILEGDAVEITVDDKNSGSALRVLRKLDIDYEIVE